MFSTTLPTSGNSVTTKNTFSSPAIPPSPTLKPSSNIHLPNLPAISLIQTHALDLNRYEASSSSASFSSSVLPNADSVNTPYIASSRDISSPHSASAKVKLKNKQQDIGVLYQMLSALLAWEEQGRKETLKTVEFISGLAGGTKGISFSKDPESIRNRYGRDNPDVCLPGFIDLEQLHRAFIVIKAGKPLLNTLVTDFSILQSKILFILHRELHAHPNESLPFLTQEQENTFSHLPTVGNESLLQEIPHYVREHYYQLCLTRIKEELPSLQGEISTKDHLYSIARTLIITGELGSGIRKDLQKTTSSFTPPLSALIQSFTELNHLRNRFVHPSISFVKEFEENATYRENFNKTLNNLVTTLLALLENEESIAKEIITTIVQSSGVISPPLPRTADPLFNPTERKRARAKKPNQPPGTYSDLVQTIQSEMEYLLEIEKRNPPRKSVIQEYVITRIAQSMRELEAIAPLQNTLFSYTAQEAGSLMQESRNNGLAHEILNFDASKFEKALYNIILPSAPDFKAINTLSQQQLSKTFQSKFVIANAYIRLCLYDEAIRILLDLSHILQTDPQAIEQEIREHLAIPSNTIIYISPLFKNIAAPFILICHSTLVQVYFLKKDYTQTTKIAQEILASYKNLSGAEDETLNTLADIWYTLGQCALHENRFNDAFSSLMQAYHLATSATQKDTVNHGLQHCRQLAQKHHHPVPSNIPAPSSTVSGLSASLRFHIEFADYYLHLETKNFTAANKIFNSTRHFLQTHSTELRQEQGDRYPLYALHLLEAEIAYFVQTNSNSGAKGLADFEQQFQTLLTQLPPQLQKGVDIGTALTFLSRAYSHLAQATSNLTSANALFSAAQDKLREASLILSIKDTVFIKAVKEFTTHSYNYQMDNAQINPQAVIDLLTLALTVNAQYNMADNPNIFTRLGIIYLHQAAQCLLKEPTPEKAFLLYQKAYTYLDKAKILFEQNQANLETAEFINYHIVIRSMGECHEEQVVYYRYKLQEVPYRSHLEQAIQFYSTYLAFPNIDDQHVVEKRKQICVDNLLMFDKTRDHTSTAAFTAEEKTMKKIFIDHFNKASKEKKKNVLFKNIKDKEAFIIFLRSRFNIPSAEIIITPSNNYIMLKLSEQSINLIKALQK